MNPTDELAAALTDEGQAVLKKWPVEWETRSCRYRLVLSPQTPPFPEFAFRRQFIGLTGHWERDAIYHDSEALARLTRHLIDRLAAWARAEEREMYLAPNRPCGWKIDIFGTPGISSRKSELLDVLVDAATQILEIDG